MTTQQPTTTKSKLCLLQLPPLNVILLWSYHRRYNHAVYRSLHYLKSWPLRQLTTSSLLYLNSWPLHYLNKWPLYFLNDYSLYCLNSCPLHDPNSWSWYQSGTTTSSKADHSGTYVITDGQRSGHLGAHVGVVHGHEDRVDDDAERNEEVDEGVHYEELHKTCEPVPGRKALPIEEQSETESLHPLLATRRLRRNTR